MADRWGTLGQQSIGHGDKVWGRSVQSDVFYRARGWRPPIKSGAKNKIAMMPASTKRRSREESGVSSTAVFFAASAIKLKRRNLTKTCYRMNIFLLWGKTLAYQLIVLLQVLFLLSNVCPSALKLHVARHLELGAARAEPRHIARHGLACPRQVSLGLSR